MELYELCEDCKYAIFHSEEPAYNEEEECVDCEGYEMQDWGF